MAVKIGWRTRDFWRTTMTEFFDAIEAFNEMHGGDKEPEAPTDVEMADLLAKYG